MRTRRWLPVALCCLPGVAVVALVGMSVLAGGAALGSALSGTLGIGLVVLAALACPLGMGLMMWRQGRKAEADESTINADCCHPEDESMTTDTGRLTVLRARREALEQELIDLQVK